MRGRVGWASWSWSWSLAVVVLSIVFIRLSLDNVSGETLRADGGCCNTEYVHGGWTLAPTLLVVPLYLIARSQRVFPLVVALAFATGSVFYIAHTGVTRIEDAGWGDGLENLSYLEAAFQTALFVAAAVIATGRQERVVPPDPPDPPVGEPGMDWTGPPDRAQP